jgi:hypothetical protein
MAELGINLARTDWVGDGLAAGGRGDTGCAVLGRRRHGFAIHRGRILAAVARRGIVAAAAAGGAGVGGASGRRGRAAAGVDCAALTVALNGSLAAGATAIDAIGAALTDASVAARSVGCNRAAARGVAASRPGDGTSRSRQGGAQQGQAQDRQGDD